MFGISAFAATPFASLAGNVFAFDITENITLADTSSQVSAFLQSLAENSTLGDSSTQLSTFLSKPYRRQYVSR